MPIFSLGRERKTETYIQHFDFSGGCLGDYIQSCLDVNAGRDMKQPGGLWKRRSPQLRPLLESLRYHRQRLAQIVLEKQKIVGALTLPIFKTYHEITVIKMVCQWHKDRHREQWNRIEKSDTNSSVYNQMIFNKHAKHYSMRKGKRCWENCISTCK